MAGEAQSDALLVEGAKSYPQALLALATFCQHVQEICGEALKRHVPELEEALGLPLRSAEVKYWANPDSLKSGEIDGTWACLGAWTARPAQFNCQVGNYIWWSKNRGLTVVLSIEFSGSGVAESVLSSLQQGGFSSLERDSAEIYLSRPLQPAQLPSLPAVLDDLNRQWIEVWRKAGGVKQFLGKR